MFFWLQKTLLAAGRAIESSGYYLHYFEECEQRRRQYWSGDSHSGSNSFWFIYF
ncbi:MAG: hypothetical protein AB1898_29825 [Acidobacteriota bacterium]